MIVSSGPSREHTTIAFPSKEIVSTYVPYIVQGHDAQADLVALYVSALMLAVVVPFMMGTDRRVSESSTADNLHDGAFTEENPK